jgi:hypothetical protein
MVAHEDPAPCLGRAAARTHARVLEDVRFFIETIWALFGAPETIAAMRNLTRADHKLLASWLRKAEALLRKLIAIEAADIRIEEKKYKVRLAPKRQAKLRQFNQDEPHLWRVCFRLSSPVYEGGGRAVTGGGSSLFPPSSPAATLSPHAGEETRRRFDARFPDAWPLAERFEALAARVRCAGALHQTRRAAVAPPAA